MRELTRELLAAPDHSRGFAWGWVGHGLMGPRLHLKEDISNELVLGEISSFFFNHEVYSASQGLHLQANCTTSPGFVRESHVAERHSSNDLMLLAIH